MAVASLTAGGPPHPAVLPSYASMDCVVRRAGQLVNGPGGLRHCSEQLVPLQNASASGDSKNPDTWMTKSQ